MGTPADPHLRIVPGERLVLFLLRLDGGAAVWASPPARFLEGLRAACDLLRFGPVQRDEPSLDELLPWTGNV